MYRQRFGFTGHPLPKDAHGKTFFDQGPGYKKLERAFRQLVADPGLGVLTADAGVGKTAAIRNLCAQLPKPDYLVLYLCDTAVAPLDLYRTLATELGVRPSHRRAQLWTDIKKALVHLVDERGTSPLIILDEAQHLSDPFLIDLSGFLNFAFDSRDPSRCGSSVSRRSPACCACSSTPPWPCASSIRSTSIRSIATALAPWSSTASRP